MQVFVFFVVLIAGLFVAYLAVQHYTSGSGDRRTVKQARADANAERKRSEIAQKALREIAAGNAAPVLIASNALDEVHNTYGNELN